MGDRNDGLAAMQRDAEAVYNYHRMGMALEPSDAVFALCSLDTRVAVRAAQLWLDGFGTYLIYSGGVGKLTEARFTKPEAEVFADIARAWECRKIRSSSSRTPPTPERMSASPTHC